MVTEARIEAAGRSVFDIDDGGRLASRAAAGLTVGGAVTLGVFFAIGEPWGTINDALSIGLAVATVPIAVAMTRANPSGLVRAGAACDVAGAAIASLFTASLIARRMTFEASLPGVMTGQALIGSWLILVGVAAWREPGSRPVAAFGIAGGLGLVAIAAGLATGGMQSPLAAAGFLAGIVGTAGFYTLLGRRPTRPG